MRLDILNHGYSAGNKALFTVIRLFSGHALPDAAKITFYRSDFYGNPAKTFTQQAMRGPSGWSVADRELMAAYVSKVNECAFCIGAHTATATQAYDDAPRVTATLEDLESAPLEEPLRATLRVLGVLVRTGNITAADLRTALSAGATAAQLSDALAVAVAFNTTNTLADVFGFTLLTPKGYTAGARFLLKRGYGG
ncbi:carboxymuconolactone decarboxylase family protein [Kribbella solani]|uniref:carboxymuconolactone decarboxylase family protein n=1 Tax=Kribbella solani TaxID=236067 RepID=UPI0029A46FC2|nr:carboxymuconolactone decarboxylase family protein [Kribbella solani]MDX3006303.1 carboxymuconolactone decarboxylase family protein [Kribbella solani]